MSDDGFLCESIQYAPPSDRASGDPFPSQKRFHQSRARFKGFSGPVGAGKSQALCFEALRLGYENRGLRGLIGAPTYPMLADATRVSFLEILENNRIPHRFDVTRNSIILLEPKSTIMFRALDHYERLRGPNLAWFGVDELTYVKPEAWQRLEARLRHPQATRLCGYGCWTPKGFDWVYNRFIGPKRIAGHESFLGDQNVALDPSYYEGLKSSYDPRFYQQEALGEYLSVFSGQTYYPFLRERNVRELAYSPKHPLWWALDFNVNPMCSVIGQTINGTIRVLDELVLPDSNTLAACEEFLSRAEQWSAPPDVLNVPQDTPGFDEIMERLNPAPLNLYIYGDASGEHRETSASRTDWQIVRDFFGRYTDRFHVQFRVPTKNPVVKDRINCVNAKLRNYLGERSLLISSRCEELAVDFEQVAWKADPHGNILSDLNKSDPMRTHLSDALGYYVAREFPMRRKAGERGGPALM